MHPTGVPTFKKCTSFPLPTEIVSQLKIALINSLKGCAISGVRIKRQILTIIVYIIAKKWLSSTNWEKNLNFEFQELLSQGKSR